MNRQTRIVLIGGGARSGKSAFALRRACEVGRRRAFLATAEAGDGEMAERIRHHRNERDASFRTVESPLDLVANLQALRDTDVAVVDCLTLWLSNLLLQEATDEAIEAEVEALAGTLPTLQCSTVLVSNEVGLGLVPESALGRRFRDLAGRAHQRIAACADEVYFAAFGMVVRLRPAPVVAFHPMEGVA